MMRRDQGVQASNQPLRSTDGERQRLSELKVPVESDWEAEKEWLIYNYDHLNWSPERLSEVMRDKGYQVSDLLQYMSDADCDVGNSKKSVQNHLRDHWDRHRNQSTAEKLNLLARILEAQRTDTAMPEMTVKEMVNLRRYLNERGDGSDATIAVSALLGRMVRSRRREAQVLVTEVSQDVPEGSHDVTEGSHDVTEGSHDVTEVSQDLTERSQDVDLQAFEYLNLQDDTSSFSEEISEIEGSLITPSDSDELLLQIMPESSFDLQADTRPDQASRQVLMDAEPTIYPEVSEALALWTAGHLPTTQQPPHFSDKYEALHVVSNLVREHYFMKMKEYLTCTQAPPTGAFETPMTPDSIAAATAANKTYWDSLQSAVYYFKVGSEDLFKIELDETYYRVEQICSLPAPTLLRNILANLSPAAMRAAPKLGWSLIDLFHRHSTRIHGFNHPLTKILRILFNEKPEDGLSMTALQILSAQLDYVLPQRYQENFDAKYDLVKLLRWADNLTDATAHTVSLVKASEESFGEDSVNTRRALSEYAYIMNKHGKYREALNVVVDVRQRAQRSLGTNYPDELAIYGMEDEAEIYENLGKIQESINILKKARRAALRTWSGTHTSTTYIIEKLDRLQDIRVV